MNLFEAVVERDNHRLVCRVGDTELELPTDVSSDQPSLANYAGRRVAIGIRPEDVREASDWDGARLRGRILLIESLGSEQLVHIEIAAAPLERSDLIDTTAQPPGPSLGVDDAERSVAIDLRLLHFFDLETGVAIPTVDVPVVAPVVS